MSLFRKKKKKKNGLFGGKKRQRSNSTTIAETIRNQQVDGFANHNLFGKSILECEMEVITSYLFDSMEYIEKNCNVEGIFRKSGSFAKKSELIRRLNESKPISQSVLNKIGDAYVVCDLLKDYFKKLREPLMKTVYVSILNNMEFGMRSKKVIRDKISEVLDPYEIVLLYRLFKLLNHIARNQLNSKMGASNLALLFTALLYHRPLMDFMKDAEVYKRGLALTTVFVDQYEYFFGGVFKGSFASNPRLAFKIFLIGTQN